MPNPTFALKKIPVLALLVGTFIIGGGGYIAYSHMPAKTVTVNALAAQPSLDALFDTPPSKSFAFSLDGNWDASSLSGMPGAKITVHSDGASNVHVASDSGISAAVTIAFGANGANLYSIAGDVRTHGPKIFVRVNSAEAPMSLSSIFGTWFANDGSAGLPTANLDAAVSDGEKNLAMTKKIFHLAEDQGTEMLDGVQIRNVRVDVDKQALTDAMKNGNTTLSELGAKNASDADVSKVADALGAGTLVLGIDGKGNLHRATWSMANESGSQNTIVLRISHHNEPVTIEEPTDTHPFSDLMSLIKL